jgi:hypothetical protein
VTGVFRDHASGSQSTRLIVYERKQLIRRRWITRFDPSQYSCDVTHEAKHSWQVATISFMSGFLDQGSSTSSVAERAKENL